MLTLKLPTRKKSAPGAATTAPEPQTPRDEFLQPRRSVCYGRTVAFVHDQTGLQMAAISQSVRGPKVLDCRKIYFPAALTSDEDRAAYANGKAEEFLKKSGGRNPRVVMAVGGPQTVFRTFTLPEVDGKALTSAVSFEARKQIPFPFDECLYDFRPIQRSERDGRKRLKIALNASTKEQVHQQMAPIESLSGNITNVYHTHDVLGQVLRFLPEFGTRTQFILLNIERNRTELSYYRGTDLEFYHICPIGSSFLANRSDFTVFEYFAESLANEIQNSFDYYSGQFSAQATNRIYIYGDLAYSEELIESLTDRFGFEFRRFPIDDLGLHTKTSSVEPESLAVSLPAVAAATCAVKLANLLPAEHKKRITQNRQVSYIRAAGILLAALLVFLWHNKYNALADRTAQLAVLQGKINDFQNSTLFDTYNVLKRTVDAGQVYLQKAAPKPSYFAVSLKEISRLAPEAVRLTVIDWQPKLEGNNLHVQGTVIGTEVPPEVVVAEFVANLNASPLFDQGAVAHHSKKQTDRGSVMEFDISLKGLL